MNEESKTAYIVTCSDTQGYHEIRGVFDNLEAALKLVDTLREESQAKDWYSPATDGHLWINEQLAISIEPWEIES